MSYSTGAELGNKTGFPKGKHRMPKTQLTAKQEDDLLEHDLNRIRERKAKNIAEMKRLGAIENAFKEFGKEVYHAAISQSVSVSFGRLLEQLELKLKNLNYKPEKND